MIKHCIMCGSSHEQSEPCPPEAFSWFRCASCGRIQNMPWDAVGFMWMDGAYCGCGAAPRDTWESISAQEGHAALTQEKAK